MISNLFYFVNGLARRFYMLVHIFNRFLGDSTSRQAFEQNASEATLEKAHVVKEVRATFSAATNLEKGPTAQTRYRNFFLAGDWTRSGWPATMEGAVRSGYLAAEAVTRHFGKPRQYCLPDIA